MIAKGRERSGHRDGDVQQRQDPGAAGREACGRTSGGRRGQASRSPPTFCRSAPDHLQLVFPGPPLHRVRLAARWKSPGPWRWACARARVCVC